MRSLSKVAFVRFTKPMMSVARRFQYVFLWALLVRTCLGDAVPLRHTGKKRILVTGAAGFVGSHAAEHFLARGDDVVVIDEVNDYYDVAIKESNLDLLVNKYGSDRVKIYRGDICDTDLLQSIFQQEKPKWVCHMAARAGVRPSIQDPLLYVHSNVEGTTKLLEFSRQHGVENFVFASSSSVYGGSKETLFDESQLVDRPISPYAATKKACELMAFTYHHLYGLNVTGLRFFTVYGPRGRPDMAPFKFIDRVSRGVSLQQFGDGSSSRDYTYIDDIVDGVLRAVDRPYPYQILNLGKGSGTKLNEFLKMVEKYVGKKAIIELLPDQPGDVPYTCANVSKAELLLGYKSSVPFEEGIKKTVAWYQETHTQDVTEDGAPIIESAGKEGGRRLAAEVEREQIGVVPLANSQNPPTPSTATLWGKTRQRNLENTPSWATVPVIEPHTGKKTVLVTGAAGFVGSHVADMLLKRGDDVIVVDEVNSYYDVSIKRSNLNMLVTKYGKNRVRIYEGDICNVEFMSKIFEDEKPEWVCHMAARAGVRPSIEDPFIYVHSNLEATTALLELSRKHQVKNFVFASSSSVYGGSKSTLFDEAEVVDRPISPYAATKKSCELMAYTYHHLYGMKVSGLRFFTVYGPRGRPDMAPFKFIDRVSRGVTLQQFGDGSSSRDYTYIDDIADGVIRAIDRPYSYQLFNLGKGSGTNLKEFLALVEKYVGKKAKIELLPDQPGDVPYTCANVNKAQHLLGYKSKVPFEEGIRRTVEWYKKAYPLPVESPDDIDDPPESLEDSKDQKEGSENEDDVEASLEDSKDQKDGSENEDDFEESLEDSKHQNDGSENEDDVEESLEDSEEQKAISPETSFSYISQAATNHALDDSLPDWMYPTGEKSWIVTLIYAQWAVVTWFCLHRIVRSRQHRAVDR